MSQPGSNPEYLQGLVENAGCDGYGICDTGCKVGGKCGIYGGKCGVYGGKCGVYGGKCVVYGGKCGVYGGKYGVDPTSYLG